MVRENPSALQAPEISLRYLFISFLKIGAVSFGGNMALIAVIKNVMVDKDQKLKNEVILDALSIGSLLPGPLAVNVVANIGYSLRKTKGAVVSMVAILLPAVTAMLILSWLYFRFGWNQKSGSIFVYITGAVAAIILATALQFYQKEVKGSWPKILLALLGLGIAVFSSSFGVTIAGLISGGLVGWMLQLSGAAVPGILQASKIKLGRKNIIAFGFLFVLLLLFLSGMYQFTTSVWLQISIVFSGISLSLFGGGYVMIPIMQALFVHELGWLTRQEFLDAIAFSQLTPGPILVSATFVGYKLAGWVGAALATFSIFTPSAILMILVSKIYAQFSHLSSVKNILSGVKAVVIGLIAGAAVKIGIGVSWTGLLAVVAVGSFVLSYFYKISPVYIILTCLFLATGLWYFKMI